MAKSRTRGIYTDADGNKTINKVINGERIFLRLGAVTQEEAEERLLEELKSNKRKAKRSAGPVFADGAARYLKEQEEKKIRTLGQDAYHISILLEKGKIGHLPFEEIHDGTLEKFKRIRREEGVTGHTINESLKRVAKILTRAARAWRDDNGKRWLMCEPPIITMEVCKYKETKPISWDEQDKIFPLLPASIGKLCLFLVNCGARSVKNGAMLRWEWEHYIKEVKRSVFVIPAEHFKSNRPFVLILNDVAWSIVESQRGKDDVWVFPHKGGCIEQSLNNHGWRLAREKAGMPWARVHGLRHTFSARLRAAGVPEEDRNTLMGHKTGKMSELYSSADIIKLIEQANKANERKNIVTVLRVVNG